jgi:hypothetical protein
MDGKLIDGSSSSGGLSTDQHQLSAVTVCLWWVFKMSCLLLLLTKGGVAGRTWWTNIARVLQVIAAAQILLNYICKLFVMCVTSVKNRAGCTQHSSWQLLSPAALLMEGVVQCSHPGAHV